MSNDDRNKGKDKDSLQKAIEKAGWNAADGPGTYDVKITVEVGNPQINEYKVEIVKI